MLCTILIHDKRINNIPHSTISSSSFRASLSRAKDLGVDETEKEEGEGVDEVDTGEEDDVNHGVHLQVGDDSQ